MFRAAAQAWPLPGRARGRAGSAAMAAASAMFASQLTYRSLKFDEAAWRAARHVLHVDASHGAGSGGERRPGGSFAEPRGGSWSLAESHGTPWTPRWHLSTNREVLEQPRNDFA